MSVVTILQRDMEKASGAGSCSCFVHKRGGGAEYRLAFTLLPLLRCVPYNANLTNSTSRIAGPTAHQRYHHACTRIYSRMQLDPPQRGPTRSALV